MLLNCPLLLDHYKPRAGFVKVCVSPERRKSVQEFVGKSIQPGTMVNTDGGPSMMLRTSFKI